MAATIVKLEERHLTEVMDIWLKTNISTHDFIDSRNWLDLRDDVQEAMLQADVYVYQDEEIIKGFIGLVEGGYIAGLFVRDGYQSEGIGARLVGYCKEKYEHLALDVYVENVRAVRFYEKNGFTIVEKKMNDMFPHEEYRMTWQVD